MKWNVKKKWKSKKKWEKIRVDKKKIREDNIKQKKWSKLKAIKAE